MSIYSPILKLEHQVPMEIDMRCPGCRARTVYVNFAKHFYLKCLNLYCPRFHVIEPLSCFLEHRDHALQQMQLLLKDDIKLWLTPTGQPDFNHPEYNPSLMDGPYRNCPGFLEWDNSRAPSRDTWLICNRCQAVYHAIIFASYGVAEPTLHYSDFRIKTEAGKRTLVSNWSASDRVVEIPKRMQSIALIIDKVMWAGQEIREFDSIKK